MVNNVGGLFPIGYLPTAAVDRLGVVKIGDGLEILDGLLSAKAVVERKIFTLITPSIEAGQNLQTSLEVEQDFFIIQVTTNVAARVRVYAGAAYQAADVARGLISNSPATNYPTGDHGLLAEVRTAAAILTITRSPISMISVLPASKIVPITVSNLSAAAAIVTVQFITFQLI